MFKKPTLLTSATAVIAVLLSVCSGLGVNRVAEAETPTAKPFDDEFYASQLAANQAISIEDARQAIADTGPLATYTAEYSKSREVGPVWATYGDGYEVHAGVLNDQDPQILKSLERELGHDVVEHHGGASLGELYDASEYMAHELHGKGFTADFATGYLEVERGVELPPDVISPEFVRETYVAPEPLPPAHGGVSWQVWNGSSWVNQCSLGFYARAGSTGAKYAFTAAHCGNGWYLANTPYGALGQTSGASNAWESCGVDVQRQQYAGPTSVQVFDMAFGGVDTLMGGASSPYVGQPISKFGMATGVTTGVVLSIGNQGTGATADCPGGSFFWGLSHSALTCPGDSGGTVTLIASGARWLAGITSGGNCSTIGNNAWWQEIVYAGGTPGLNICTYTSSAGCMEVTW